MLYISLYVRNYNKYIIYCMHNEIIQNTYARKAITIT